MSSAANKCVEGSTRRLLTDGDCLTVLEEPRTGIEAPSFGAYDDSVVRGAGGAKKRLLLLQLPPEVLLLILEVLVVMAPIDLLGRVPGVCKRLRALCSRVQGTLDAGNSRDLWIMYASPPYWRRGAMSAVDRLFGQLRGLEVFGEHPLLDACDFGLASVVARMVEAGTDVNELQWWCGRKVRALDVACRAAAMAECEVKKAGALHVIRLLLDAGANMKGCPLHFAIGRNGLVDVVAELLAGGCNPNKMCGGEFPLAKAVSWDLYEIAECLLRAGARTDHPAIVQSVAVAAELGNEPMLALLARYKADLNLACLGRERKLTLLEFVRGRANEERSAALLVKYGARRPCGAKRSATTEFGGQESRAEEASGVGEKRSATTEAPSQQFSVRGAPNKESATDEGEAAVADFPKCADNCSKRRRRR